MLLYPPLAHSSPSQCALIREVWSPVSQGLLWPESCRTIGRLSNPPYTWDGVWDIWHLRGSGVPGTLCLHWYVYWTGCWDHFSCLSFTVLRDGLSVMLRLRRKKDRWIVVLRWRRLREKHHHCGSHIVAYLPAAMCPKSSLCCIKEKRSLDITTSAFLHRLFQFCIL